MNKPYKGIFITIEGGDGSGKSTLAELLASALKQKGYDVTRTREPGGTPLAESLRNLILHTPSEITMNDRSELLLFLAARVSHIEEVILPCLRKGHVVICERFNDSSVAYQGCARHMGMRWTEQMCRLACQDLEPECTLFLDIDPEEGLKRCKKQRVDGLDRLEQEKLQFHREVRQAYLHLADENPGRIVVLDAQQSAEKVLEQALNILQTRLLLGTPR